MKAGSFDELCQFLARDGGGFTLWSGAGASVAATGGRLPTWDALTRALGETDGTGDFPDRLERLSQTVGHPAFRRQLREKLIDALRIEDFDAENLLHQAIIAARAGALVSFNVEFYSASAHSLLRGGESFLPRTFRQRSAASVSPVISTDPGLVGSPVYFPHGLLLQGNVVLTRSEYDRHVASVAMTTAVHLCIGADLVIIGMSLADAYLRRALLENRAWIRNVYWIGEVDGFQFREWARVADVTCVNTPNRDLWPQLAEAILREDTNGTLRSWASSCRGRLPTFLQRLLAYRGSMDERLTVKAKELLIAKRDPKELRVFADFCIDVGYDVPKELAEAIGLPSDQSA